MNTNEDTEVVGFRYLLLLSWVVVGLLLGIADSAVLCALSWFCYVGCICSRVWQLVLGVLIHGSSHAVGSCSVCSLPDCGLLLIGCLIVLDCLSDSCVCSLLLLGRLRA